MRKPLLFVLVCLFLYGALWAQPRASFTYTQPYYVCDGRTVSIEFTSKSTPSSQYPITGLQWNFGDGSIVNTSSYPFIYHTYTQPGVYTVTLTATDTTGKDTFASAITIQSLALNLTRTVTPFSCNRAAILFNTNAQTTDTLTYAWSIGGGGNNIQYSQKGGTEPFIRDTFLSPRDATMFLNVYNKAGRVCYIADTFIVTTGSPILSANGERNLTANRQCNDESGWTHYYYNNNTPVDETDDSLLLSLKTNGNFIGTIGDGTFSVSVASTAGAGSNTGILLTNPLINNQSGFYVMNRYWSVTPTVQPITPVGVRFYFNNQDVADVNGSYPSHDLDIRKLIFYKTHGGNPDPTTNLEGAQYITSLTYIYYGVDTTHWTDFSYGYDLDKHMAEFQVSSFSGGGGGATGNGQVLPVQLTSFTANNNGNKVTLQWTTAQEINVSKYNVEVSADGRQFTTLGTVAAHGKTMPDTYTFSYNETMLTQAYYRLQMVEKNGTVSGSQVAPLSFVRANNNITLYPNPAKNAVQVKAVGFENKQVTAVIYNAAGMKVSATSLYFTAGVATLNTASLASGHYTVALRDEQIVMHLPLVIVK